MSSLLRLVSIVLLVGCAISYGQTTILTCVPSATPPTTRIEGLTERVGDILITCSGGQPAAAISGNLTLFLGVPITNRLSAGNTSDVMLTYDVGAGPQTSVPGVLAATSTLVFNNVKFNLSASGGVVLRIADVRVNVTGYQNFAGVPPIVAQASFNSGNDLPIPQSTFTVGYARTGLYNGFSGKLICAPNGSPLPTDTTSLAAFLASNAVFTSTRITEGFADAFSPHGYFANLNADSGERFLVRYSGFPAGARLFVPNVVAGSDAIQPTAGGDFGLPASGGSYAPSAKGSLLLARVPFANANGAGGVPIYTPDAIGSGTVSFDSMTELPIDNTGSAYVVYEVVDANPNLPETAQFPTFLGLAPSGGGNAIQTTETVTFAPTSNIGTATSADPIPRFLPITPGPDCSLVGDCGASYQSVLYVDTTPLVYTAQQGSGNQPKYFIVNNRGGGVLNWTASVNYATANGGLSWLQLYPTSGVNNGTVRVDAIPGLLSPGVYQANIVINAGPLAGSQSVPVTLTITAPPVQLPAISSVLNAASFAAGPVVPGSLTTLMGTKLSAKSLRVTFDGVPAQVLFANDTQINLLAPDALQGKTTSQLIVTVDGIATTPRTVQVAAFGPAIFSNGVLNQDYTANSSSHPAPMNTALQIFATGLSGTGGAIVQLGGQSLTPLYAGAAPGFPGLQQVDVLIPAGSVPGQSILSICGSNSPWFQTCSPAVPVYIAPATGN